MITVSTQPVYNLQAEVKETLLDYYATMGMTEALRRCLKSGIDRTKVIILPYYIPHQCHGYLILQAYVGQSRWTLT